MLDELHTYRGRQGADVGFLVRRTRDACAAPQMQCVGTSATMTSAGTVSDSTSRRAWLVPDSNVDGDDLVPQWLAEGFVSLAAAQLPEVDPDANDAVLRQLVDEAYRHKNYSVRERLVGEFSMFLRQMRQNDVVLTTRGGRFYVGAIDGPPVFVDSPDRRSNLRLQYSQEGDFTLPRNLYVIGTMNTADPPGRRLAAPAP